MTEIIAHVGCEIFDGIERHKNKALVVKDGIVLGIMAAGEIPDTAALASHEGGLLTAGFVDLQVNGGGGVMFNDCQDTNTLQTICDAHLPFGTTSLLPTLITDSDEITQNAIKAAIQAQSSVAGMIGLHLEGPHLSVARKGAHDPQYIRQMSKIDLEKLINAAQNIDTLFVTVAPESVSTDQIKELTKNGIIVSIGHTDTTIDEVHASVDAGASCVTHLFNAMSQFTGRNPGVVGGALYHGSLSAGLIADGFHVSPESIDIALRAKKGPGKIFLITDAMATIGTDQNEFMLNGRVVKRSEGRLTMNDTLAGADLDMISAVRFVVNKIGLDVDEALRMASLYPAQVINRQNEVGQLISGARADFINLNSSLEIKSVWRAGQPLYT